MLSENRMTRCELRVKQNAARENDASKPFGDFVVR